MATRKPDQSIKGKSRPTVKASQPNRAYDFTGSNLINKTPSRSLTLATWACVQYVKVRSTMYGYTAI